MEAKKCFKCGRVLPLSDFYKNRLMADGHLNKCKECTKRDVHNNYIKKRLDEKFITKERERGREKYWRLYSPKMHNPRNDHSNVESYSKCHSTRRYLTNLGINLTDSEVIHHWNYNYPYDVFVISKKAHRLAHRFLTIDNNSGMFYYKGNLLNTKEKHRHFLDEIFQEYDYSIKEISIK